MKVLKRRLYPDDFCLFFGHDFFSSVSLTPYCILPWVGRNRYKLLHASEGNTTCESYRGKIVKLPSQISQNTKVREGKPQSPSPAAATTSSKLPTVVRLHQR